MLRGEINGYIFGILVGESWRIEEYLGERTI